MSGQSAIDRQASPGSPGKRKWPKRCLFVLYVLALLEIGCRLYWTIDGGVPFFRMGGIFRSFYPVLRTSGARDADLPGPGGGLNVLLLGGSTLDAKYSDIGQQLQRLLGERTGRGVRVFNAARRGHTSRDSLNKYALLEGKRFDLVVLYDGINDVRMNNIPAGRFREDYSHVCWYMQLRRLEAHREVAWVAFPYTLEYAALRILDSERLGVFAPRHDPRQEWVRYGSEIKTAGAFRGNVAGILRTARGRGEPVLLMTFASYIPPDYTLEKFLAKSLDYDGHRSPVEMWGTPANVAATLKVHNQVLRDLAGRYDNALLVDQEALMPKGRECFNDCCHFTPAGCRKFVENILEPILQRLGAEPPG